MKWTMPFGRPTVILTLCALILSGPSCVVRRRLIVRAGAKAAPSLSVATQETLVQAIARQYDAIRDLSATVDMVPALGSAEKSKITEYKDVRGYILFRKPADIRIIGLYPVVRSKAFDMVADGSRFKLYTPAKNLFIEGRNEIIQPAPNKLENLRPQHFLEALLVRPVDAAEKVMLENLTDEDEAVYILHIVHDQNGTLQLARDIWFNRVNLQIERQLVFDASGNILTDARYSDWRPYDNVRFPKHIEINRPQDEYGVVLDVVKMDINKGVTDDKFVLEQPPGTTLKTIGAATTRLPATIGPGPVLAARGK
jgi:outer membrane lipoprotein-sorting protein